SIVTDAIYGSVLYLDGSSCLVTSSNLASPVSNSARTFSMWMKSSDTNYGILFSYGDNTLNNSFARAMWRYATCAFTYSTDSGTVQTASLAGAASTWYHFAVTVTSAGSASIYVNGSSVSTATGVLHATTAKKLGIGCVTYNTSSSTFNGYYSDFRIYTSSLSSGNIATIYTNG
ncbi:unnamed protein product, partial [Phaeothamnion confervicola]